MNTCQCLASGNRAPEGDGAAAGCDVRAEADQVARHLMQVAAVGPDRVQVELRRAVRVAREVDPRRVRVPRREQHVAHRAGWQRDGAAAVQVDHADACLAIGRREGVGDVLAVGRHARRDAVAHRRLDDGLLAAVGLHREEVTQALGVGRAREGEQLAVGAREGRLGGRCRERERGQRRDARRHEPGDASGMGHVWSSCRIRGPLQGEPPVAMVLPVCKPAPQSSSRLASGDARAAHIRAQVPLGCDQVAEPSERVVRLGEARRQRREPEPHHVGLAKVGHARPPRRSASGTSATRACGAGRRGRRAGRPHGVSTG